MRRKAELLLFSVVLSHWSGWCADVSGIVGFVVFQPLPKPLTTALSAPAENYSASHVGVFVDDVSLFGGGATRLNFHAVVGRVWQFISIGSCEVTDPHRPAQGWQLLQPRTLNTVWFGEGMMCGHRCSVLEASLFALGLFGLLHSEQVRCKYALFIVNTFIYLFI